MVVWLNDADGKVTARAINPNPRNGTYRRSFLSQVLHFLHWVLFSFISLQCEADSIKAMKKTPLIQPLDSPYGKAKNVGFCCPCLSDSSV